jgi:hypothetical protein
MEGESQNAACKGGAMENPKIKIQNPRKISAVAPSYGGQGKLQASSNRAS